MILVEDVDIYEKIRRRRYQILVHSFLYYDMNTNIVSDHQWSEWAIELVDLQSKYPDIAKEVVFHSAFDGFDASSGFRLQYRDPRIVHIGSKLLDYHNRKNS